MTRLLLAFLFLAGPVFAGEGDEVVGAAAVVDGDTIDVGGIRARIWGIDAPEAHDDGGPEATAMLQRLVEGRTVRCVHTGNWTWGRWEARCYVRVGQAELDLGALMVLRGAATDAEEFSGGYYSVGGSP